MLEKEEMQKNRIAIVCPYFGVLPDNYRYTLATMAANNFIDWYIVTDDVFDASEYKNIFCEKSSFEEIKEKIRSEFGCTITRVYKLCDYKPLYGILFKNLFAGYEFWGYSDLDILFGDLRKCLSDENLNTYDKILELGHLSVYRNEASINSICNNLEDSGYCLKHILQSDKIYVLDESYGEKHLSVNELLEQEGYAVLRKVKGCEDIISRFRNIYIVGQKRRKYIYLKFENGRLYIKRLHKEAYQEIIYAHFQKRHFLNTVYKNLDEFAVTPKGFTDERLIRENSFFPIIYDLRLLWYVKFRIRRWIDNKQTQWKL